MMKITLVIEVTRLEGRNLSKDDVAETLRDSVIEIGEFEVEGEYGTSAYAVEECYQPMKPLKRPHTPRYGEGSSGD